ncbi:hypothetical protein [Giesbergeria anulus]|uniref:Uncharacterized protein n=1 Tax=Giesbergeria anulus TaxID=180197 RepID=A0A1H9JEE4_9BURK|nr:hypothetical protein [Giesbergeria anulus]MBX9935440.1 hypothetical protein [Burkholderiaceae bacterium]SEQ85109.1 hypothetical protein SAMN02982919_01372 [Giesbergeria anulus]
MTTDLHCPACGTHLELMALFAHEVDQRAVERLIAISVPLGQQVLQYISLFTPPKTRLTLPKKIKLLLQLLPDLERGAINYKGREWLLPRSAWGQAIEQMLAARDAGRLELPMKGHGYLYAILAGQADKHEAAQEQEQQLQQRTAPRPAAVTVRGQGVAIADALQRDPALLKIEADSRKAGAMPEEVRQRWAEMLRPKGVTP